jgi:hypothetical protein
MPLLSWNPSVITARLKIASAEAATDVQRLAIIEGKRMAASNNVVKYPSRTGPYNWRLRATGPLAHFFEAGTNPHEESTLYAGSISVQSGTFSGSKKAFQALNRRTTALNRTGYGGANYAFKFRTDGGFVRGTIQHPGQDATPFLHPAAAKFEPFLIARARRAFA